MVLCNSCMSRWEAWVGNGSYCACGGSVILRMAKNTFGEVRDYSGADKMRLRPSIGMNLPALSSPIWSTP
jgi:hypothetical protein